MFDIRLVAYEPFGARIAELPQPLSIETGDPLSDTASMRIKYVKGAVGADVLDHEVEVGLEVYNPVTGKWFEPPNSRFLNVRAEGDILDPVDGIQFVLPGYSWLLSRLRVFPLSASYIRGQIDDASRTELGARNKLNAAEDAVAKAAGKSDTTSVSFSSGSPEGQGGIWVDVTDPEKPVVKLYTNNQWTASSNATVQARGREATALWVEHQQTQKSLRDAEGKSRLTKRSFVARHAGSVFAELVEEARARGNRMSGLVTKFSRTHDSAGKPWPSVPGTVEVNVGADLGSLLNTFVEGGQLDFRTVGRELQVFIQDTAMTRQVGNDAILRYGFHIDEAPDRSTLENLAGSMLFIGDDGLVFSRDNPQAARPWGVWEGSVSQSGVKTEAMGEVFARNALADSSGRRVERTRGLQFHADVTAPLPYVHYRPGDFIMAPNSKGKNELQRVQQITLTKDGKTGQVAGNIVLNDRFLEREIRNSRSIQALTGGGSIGGTGSQRENESYVDLRTPEAPQYLAAEAAGEYVKDVGYQAYVSLEWFWSRKATNGTELTDGLSDYQVQYRLVHEGELGNQVNTMAWMNAANAPGEVNSTIFGPVDGWNLRLNAAATYELRVRARGLNGRVSRWSKTTRTTVHVDVTPPEPPTAPVARGDGAIIWLEWDGKVEGGGDPPPDFAHLSAYEAAIPEGIAVDENGIVNMDELEALEYVEVQHFPLTAAGSMPIFERPYNVKHAYKFTMTDFFGNESEMSQASGIVAATPLVDDAYINERLEYARQESQREQQLLDEKLRVHGEAIEQAKLDLAAIDEKFVQVDAEMTTLDTNLGTLDTKLGALDSTVGTHKASLAALNSKMGSLDTTMADVSSDAATAKSMAQSVNTRLGTTETKLNTTASDLDVLESNFSTVQQAATRADSNATKALADSKTATEVAGQAAANFVTLDQKLTAVLASSQGLYEDSSYELGTRTGASAKVIDIGSEAVTGTKVAHFKLSSTTANAFVYWEWVPVVAGHVYRIEMRAKAAAGSPVVQGWVHARDNEGTSTAADKPLSMTDITPDWGRGYAEWTAPANTTEARFFPSMPYQYNTLADEAHVDDFQVVDITEQATLSLQVEQAKKEAEAAARKAEAAAIAANNAQKSADGKATQRYVLTEPVGFGVTHGDTWYRISGNRIIGQWYWHAANSQWIAQKVDGAQVVNFDAGYITSGYLDVAQRIRAGSIMADKVLIGFGGNLFPDPTLTNPAFLEQVPSSTYFKVEPEGTGADGGGSILFTSAPPVQTGFYWGMSDPLLRSYVTGGASYRISAKVRLGAILNVEGGVSLYGRAYNSKTGAWSFTSPGTINLPVPAAANTWHVIESLVQVPEGYDQLVLGFYLNGSRGTLPAVRWSSPTIEPATDGRLVVNGSIKGEHVEAESVAAKVGQFVKVQAANVEVTKELSARVLTAADVAAKNLFITGNATMTGKTYIENLAANKIAAATISVDQISGKDAYFQKLAAAQIAAANITTDQITGGEAWINSITANAISAAKITTSQITGGEAWIKTIAAQEITSASIKVNQLTALNSTFDSAVVDQLWAQKIAAKKILATEVIVGSGGNLVANGYGELGDNSNFSRWSHTDSASLNTPIGAANSFWTTSSGGMSPDSDIPVIPRRTYAWQFASSGQNTGQRCYFQVRWLDASNTQISSDYMVANATVNTSTWSLFNGQVQAPAGATTAQLVIYLNHPNGTQNPGQWHRFGAVEFRDATDGTLLVDGSITTKHLDARTIDITEVLRANSIKADKIDVASLHSQLITSTVFQGGTYYGANFTTDSTGSFNTSRVWNRGFHATSSGVSMYNNSGQRVMNLDAGSGDSSFTGQFTTGLPGKPSIIMSSANNSWNNLDQGVWFTADGNAYGWGNSAGQPPAAGVFTLSNPQQWAADVPLQLRGHGSGGVVAWDALTLRAMVGDGGTINVPGGGMLTRVVGGYVVNSSGGQIFDGNGNTRMIVGGASGFYLGSTGFTRYNKNSTSGGTVRMANDGCIVVAFSTRKLKEDIQDAELDERVLDVQPRTFLSKPAWEEYRELIDSPRPMPETETGRLEALSDDLRRQYGVIAEEVEELGLSELVFHDQDGEPSSVSYELFGLKLLPFVKVLWEDYKSRNGATS